MAQTPVTKTLTDLPVYADTGYAGHLLYTDSNIEYRLALTELLKASNIKLNQGGSVQAAIQYVTPESVGYVSGDATQFIVAAAAWALTNGCILTGNGKSYPITADISITGISVENITFKGTGATKVVISSFHGNNVKFDAARCSFVSGLIWLTDCKFMNCTGTSALSGNDLVADAILVLINPYFENNVFCYLRNRYGKTDNLFKVSRTLIYGLRAYNNKGDAVELNLTQIDGPVDIIDPVIDTVTGTGVANDFTGIPLGFAGMTGYAVDADPSLYVSNITIVRPKISNAKQGIHFEKCRNVRVIDCNIDVISTINTTAGLPTHGIVTYGCVGVDINGGRISADSGASTAIGIRWGVSGSAYVGPTRDVTIRNMEKVNGAMIIYSAASSTFTSDIVVSNIANMTGQFIYRGYCSSLILDNIRAYSDTAHIVEIGQTAGEGAGIYRRYQYISLRFDNVEFLNTSRGVNVNFNNLYADDISVSNTRGSITKMTETDGWRGPMLVRTGNQILLPGTTFPMGIDFQPGTNLLKSDGSGGFLVQTYGAKFPASDTIRATAVGQTYIESSNLVWTNALYGKQAGQVIVIPGAGSGGSDLTTTIIRGPYSSSSYYRLDISPGILTATASGVVIRPASTCTYKEYSLNVVS